MVEQVSTTAGAGGEIATTVLVIGEGAALFAAFCPSWFTVRSPFFHDQEAKAGNIKAIRQGEATAAVFTMLVGWAAAGMVGNPLPLWGAATVSVIMIAGYEYSIRHPAKQVAETLDPQPSGSSLERALNWRAA